MKTLQGTVTGLNTLQTAKVSVVRHWTHPIYKKQVVRTKAYACHYTDAVKIAVGDEVIIKESKPISKTKRFVVLEKVTK
ncbi:30S ribosomal protein S17 [Candidatus Woesebacteria bacterium]|nr:30S ribosomal protein S17 [Candidatus Woesebacteria bacterium]